MRFNQTLIPRLSRTDCTLGMKVPMVQRSLQMQQRLSALLFLLHSATASAVDIVNTNSAGVQTPVTGITPVVSGISNDGNTVLFWAPNQGLIFDPGPTPSLFFQNNLFVKTLPTNALVEVIRRIDNLTTTRGVEPYAQMDEPPTKVVFWTSEPNLVPGANNIQWRVLTSEIGSFQYTPVRGLPNDLLAAGMGDFAATRNLDRIYLQTRSLVASGTQIVEVSPTLPTPPIIHTLRPDGTPSHNVGLTTPDNNYPDLAASADGRILAWRGDQADIAEGSEIGPVAVNSANRIPFMRNTQTGITKRIHADDGGNLFFPRHLRVADNGSLIALNLQGYFSVGCGSGIVGINPDTEQRECISVNDAGELGNIYTVGRLDVSGDGNRVVFANSSTNLSPVAQNPSQAGIYVRDRRLRRTVRIDVNLAGEPGNGTAQAPRISKNGRWVVFSSRATNLIANDTNGNQADLFRLDLNRFLPDPNAPVVLTAVPMLSSWSVLALMLIFGILGSSAGRRDG